MARARQPRTINGAEHWFCIACLAWHPTAAFTRGADGDLSRVCTRKMQPRKPKPIFVRGISEQKGEAHSEYLDALLELQDWSAKRGEPWRAHMVEAMNERMGDAPDFENGAGI
jgi:hypothetical protein